ncbi:MAG: dCMP deaminase family protein [Clostridiales bacterium]|nr:dCMP deaminase family protein [Clostridiales bacterium]
MNKHISWDDYFMAVAILSSKRSKDDNTKVGCCIINKSKRIIGCGYNGMPNNCSDDEMNWNREGNGINTKYFYVVHAEANAILNSDRKDLIGASLYTTLFPCNECAKLIVQAGIREIIYLSDKYHGTDSNSASKLIFNKANIECREYSSIFLNSIDRIW